MSSVLFQEDKNDLFMVIAIWIIELGKSINFTKVISVSSMHLTLESTPSFLYCTVCTILPLPRRADSTATLIFQN